MDLLLVIAVGVLAINWHIQSTVSLVDLCRKTFIRIQAAVVALNDWRLAHARKNH